MTYKNLVNLYTLDKKICQMICSIEGISNDFSNEWQFLNTLERFAMSEEDLEDARRDKKKFDELKLCGERFIDEMLNFKRALNDYQHYKNHSAEMKQFFGSKNINKDLEALKKSGNLEA